MKKQLNLKLSKITIVFLVLIASLVIAVIFSNQTNPNKKGFYTKNGLIFNPADNETFTGRIVDTVENKIIEYNVVKGLKNGEFVIRYMNGNFQIKGTMKNNKNSGEWKYYYPSGQLESVGNFKNDIVSDEWIWFYENGKRKEKGNFVNGKRDGKWDLYDIDGKLKTIMYFSNGKVITKISTQETHSI